MSKTALVTFTASLRGIENENLGPVTYTVTNSPFLREDVTLNVGVTTIVVPVTPSQARYLRFLPPSASTVTKTIYLNAIGTNGWQMDPATESWFAIPSLATPPNLIVIASGTEAVELSWF